MLEKQYISLRNVHTYHKPHQFKKEYTRKTQTAKKKKICGKYGMYNDAYVSIVRTCHHIRHSQARES